MSKLFSSKASHIFLQSPVLTSILTGLNFIYAKKIFVIFQRVNNFYTYGGTGIGLALYKKIDLNNNGEIFAESQENLGSCFYIILPQNQKISIV